MDTPAPPTKASPIRLGINDQIKLRAWLIEQPPGACYSVDTWLRNAQTSTGIPKLTWAILRSALKALNEARQQEALPPLELRRRKQRRSPSTSQMTGARAKVRPLATEVLKLARNLEFLATQYSMFLPEPNDLELLKRLCQETTPSTNTAPSA